MCLCWAPLLFPDLHHHVPRRAKIGGGKVNVVPNSSEVFGADGRGPPQTTHCHTSHTTYQPYPSLYKCARAHTHTHTRTHSRAHATIPPTHMKAERHWKHAICKMLNCIILAIINVSLAIAILFTN